MRDAQEWHGLDGSHGADAPADPPGAAQARDRAAQARDRIRIGSSAPGIERLEARLHGQAFSPHRHDTYAIGVTLFGVPSFRYRGRQWHCPAGHIEVLHPDELHDGAAGTAEPFGYRIVHLDPALVQEALDGRPLPFVAEPVLDPSRLPAGRAAEIWDLDAEIDDLGRTELVVSVAEMLADAASGGGRGPGTLAVDGLMRVRDLIADRPTRRPPMDELERASGLDRWTLARQFRAAMGTSPSRFRTQRQLDLVRRLLLAGTPLAAAAAEAGFADQSHMTRQFKLAYGITPARWLAALA